MITILSLVTSVKDYVEIAHKLIETQNSANPALLDNSLNQGCFGLTDYTELGAVLTYVILSIKGFLTSFFSFSWLKTICSAERYSLPLIVPDIASAMISEISVFDSYFTNTFSFLENGLSSSNLEQNLNVASGASTFVYGFEKFMIGFFNSFFLFLPTSTAHLITLRRFVMQGLEAGYIAGLGTIAGNFLWLASIFRFTFIVIPWLSLDIFRYVLGFVLLVKYLWDSSKEFRGLGQLSQSGAAKTVNRTALEDNTKTNIFLLNFLLALTEQTSIYPFISNISFGAEGSILEGFSATSSFASDNSLQFLAIHGMYLLGILLGSFSLLQFTVWFWENPAFSIYMWFIASKSSSTSKFNLTNIAGKAGNSVQYYKVLNFVFLYLTMLCAISSIPYFGLDYTVTNPLGLIPQDRIIDQKKSTLNGPGEFVLPETSFLGMNPTDKNSRIRDGIHARRERWKERLIKYQAFDASLYDMQQGSYDILTIEDLNYGFDRFWLRRKLRNHQIRFRLFPGPWMRSLKKQLNKPGFTGPRVEFFRILFEQYYHPSFHATTSKKTTQATSNIYKVDSATRDKASKPLSDVSLFGLGRLNQNQLSFIGDSAQKTNLSFLNRNSNLAKKQETLDNKDIIKTQKGLINQYSALRKFSRNFSNRINSSYISVGAALQTNSSNPLSAYTAITNGTDRFNVIYSKSLKSLYNQMNNTLPKEKINLFRNLSKQFLTKNVNSLNVHLLKTPKWQQQNSSYDSSLFVNNKSLKKTNIRQKISKKDKLLLSLKTDLFSLPGKEKTLGIQNLKPLDFFLQKEDAFKRKLKYYSTAVTRKLSVGNNAPFFKTMLKKAFYYHKPSLRWKRTMFTAAMRRGFRKKATYPKKIVYTNTNLMDSTFSNANSASLNEKSTLIYPSTTSYSVLGKRASRYRYQIYKDVLQHWYYTPFNRLLLKFDVDSFINRQPKAHFLTKNEERLLHLRRILLADHYNTLRWYTYMQHYRTMKSRIGGTKSFANTVYNQQFQGTFKKIRHLFSITPSQGDMTVLKFEQALYNDKNNSRATGDYGKKEPPVVTSYLHEGLSINTPTIENSQKSYVVDNQLKKQDFIEQSLEVAGLYLQNEQNVKNQKIKEYIKQQNYSGLMSLLANKDSIHSSSPNNTLTVIDSKDSFLKNADNIEQNNTKGLASKAGYQLLLLQLLKECKRRLNDQTFLKNYISHRLDKRRFAASKEISSGNKSGNDRLENYNTNLNSFKSWLSPIILEKLTLRNIASDRKQSTSTSNSAIGFAYYSNKQSLGTTGLRKALNDGILATQTNKGTPLDGTSFKFPASRSTTDFEISKEAQNQQTEKEIQQTLKTIQSLNESLNINKKALKSNQNLSIKALRALEFSFKSILKLNTLQSNLLTKRAEKNIEWWRQKQRTISKRKASRKKSRFKGIAGVAGSRDAEKVKNQLNLGLEQNQYIQNASKALDKVSFNQKNRLMDNYAFDMDKYNASSAYDNSQNKANAAVLQSSQAQLTTVLRKKLDIEKTDNVNTNKNNKQSLEANNSRMLPTLLQKLFVKKFRKKRSAKDRHYRNMVVNRGFTQIHKPKNINSYLSIQDKYGAETLQSSLKSELTFFDSTLDNKEVLKKYKTSLSKEKQTATLDSENTWVGTLSDKTNSPTTTQEKIQNLLKQGYIKKSPAKKRSKRTWKRRKRAKFTKNHYKYRKRDVYSFGKLRALTKKIKRIESIQEFQNWWWNHYLPNFIKLEQQSQSVSQEKTELSKGLSQISLTQKNTSKATNSLSSKAGYNAIKNTFIKPLATPKALDIRQTLSIRENLQSTSIIGSKESNPATREVETNQQNGLLNQNVISSQQNGIENNVLDQIYENLFITNLESKNKNSKEYGIENITSLQNFEKSGLTIIPFYAGWDESLRKFVVTNRLLTRREAGSEFSLNVPTQKAESNPLFSENTKTTSYNFTNAPIQGLNEGTFLYLQTQAPLAFNAYAIDQFVPNNQSFYAPLGWKRFQFRHSIFKNWLNNKQQTNSSNLLSQSKASQILEKGYAFKLKNTSLSNFQYFKKDTLNGFKSSVEQSNQKTKIQNRRVLKRYKLLKQTPIQLMYVPTGTLLTEILPSHYISVFDKQYRFPRNRYLKRNLPKANSTKGSQNTIKDLTILESSKFMFNRATSGSNIETIDSSALDFTLRKRIKPRRKYHKKRFTKKEGLIFPRRRIFGTTGNTIALLAKSLFKEENSENLFRLRPSIKSKQTVMGKSKTQKRAGQPKANPVRLRQLRRREFQQVFKPLQRFQPRSGGFVWPGDYLRLEVVPMPKLQVTLPDAYSKVTSASVQGTTDTPTVINKVKRKINVQPVGLLPRKYLIQKHNIKVLKKKMALSFSAKLI